MDLPNPMDYTMPRDQLEEGEIQQEPICGLLLLVERQRWKETLDSQGPVHGHCVLSELEIQEHLQELGMSTSSTSMVARNPVEDSVPDASVAAPGGQAENRAYAPNPASAVIAVRAFGKTVRKYSRRISSCSRWTLEEDIALFRGMEARKKSLDIIRGNKCLAGRTPMAIQARSRTLRHQERIADMFPHSLLGNTY
jgi:hypothetical protein